MRFPPAFIDELRQRISVADVVGRRVKLTRAGREFKGLCPFHNEKTPSFHVVEDKDFYHCFGCGAHGDAISFLENTEGLSFPEAVERLAAEAGLEVPRPDPAEMVREEKRAGLTDVMEAACQWFETQLTRLEGREARDYLTRRGIRAATIKEFRMGYAPSGRTGLKSALLKQGIDEAQLIEAGLLIQPEDGSPSFDRFRDRVMFAITDRRDRVIAFGGRALAKDAKAKYLNSPETPIFHKGHTLYNLAGARKPAYDSQRIVVVEGYMDAIALSQVGIGEAVAPLGTALTEEQIDILWKMAPEPILCFDGDNAGLRAAARAVDRALPRLKAGLSLRFALLPEGLDPDDLIRSQGRDAMENVLASALPMADFLWKTLSQTADISTPERQAGLEKTVFSKLAEIEDEKVKGFYQRDFGGRLRALFNPPRPSHGPQRYGPQGQWRTRFQGRPGQRRRFPPEPARNYDGATLGRSPLGQIKDNASRTHYEQIILLTVLNHPEVLVRHLEVVADCPIQHPELDKMCREVLRVWIDRDGLDRQSLRNHLSKNGFEGAVHRLESSPALQPVWQCHSEAALSDADMGLEHTMLRLRRMDVEAELKLLVDTTDGTDFDRQRALIEELQSIGGREAELESFGLASDRAQS